MFKHVVNQNKMTKETLYSQLLDQRINVYKVVLMFIIQINKTILNINVMMDHVNNYNYLDNHQNKNYV